MANDEQIEIKVNIAGDVRTALQTLTLPDGAARSIYFLEDLTVGLSSTHPLLDEGVVLRLRRDHDGSMDSTVKLRPCRRSQLAKAWAEAGEEEDQWEYRIEGDWAGSRRVLAASLVVDLTAADWDQAVGANGSPSAGFNQRQRDFLQECADIRINTDSLILLGPIRATVWKKLDLSDFKVNAERWQIGALDFLELSVRVKADVDKAARSQAEFEAAVLAQGLMIEANKRSKTQTVLEFLADSGAP